MIGRVLAILLLSLSAATATAHNYSCGPREVIVERLNDVFGETRQAIGLGVNNTVMEVFAFEETGTWTITITLPDGLTCILASGQAYDSLDEDLTPTGSLL